MGIWDTIMGNSAAEAANAAAADTYAKQQAATQGMRTAGDQYQSGIQGISGAYNPYIQAGGGALQMLMSGLGLGGAGGQNAFTNAYRGLPGYQSGLETGTNAALRGINASGMSNSGRALKALQRFGSDYEDQRVGSYLDRLTGLQGQGLQATGAQAGMRAQGEQGRLGAYTGAYGQDYGAAGTIGEGMVAGEQARQQGIQNLFNTGAQLVGTIAGGGIGGPIGAQMGSKLGSSLFSAGSKATGGQGSFIGTGNEWWK